LIVEKLIIVVKHNAMKANIKVSAKKVKKFLKVVRVTNSQFSLLVFSMATC
jgi:hypothetical protein